MKVKTLDLEICYIIFPNKASAFMLSSAQEGQNRSCLLHKIFYNQTSPQKVESKTSWSVARTCFIYFNSMDVLRNAWHKGGISLCKPNIRFSCAIRAA